MNNNVLARFFDWMGDALERFNPSAFRFLAATLPYLTPIPVAWMTAHSASKFLSFTPQVAFILVFSLEGIGLWFTTMFVDAVVDWVRSRNWKSFVPVVLFSFTVTAYVMILVSLNVTLEEANGTINPALSRVVTLFCFLPLITGVGNGYYKLKLEHKTETQKAKEHQEEIDEKIRKEKREERLERLRIKTGNKLESSKKVSSEEESFQEGSGKMETWRKIKGKLSRKDLEKLATLSPDSMRQYASQTGFTYKTISNWRSNARDELGMSKD